MFGEAIESLEIGFDGAELAQAHRLLDRLSARVSVADGEFDRGEGWDLDAATSMTAWLRTQAGMTAGDAVQAVRMAKRLGSLPVTRAADLDDDDKGEPESSLYLSSLLEGRWRLDGDLGPWMGVHQRGPHPTSETAA
jgi:hypothetical protein